jgi:hypothetical protein
MDRLSALRLHLDDAGRLPNVLDLDRCRASFAVSELTQVLYGGARLTELRRRVQLQVSRDSVLSTATQRSDWSRDEERRAAAAGAVRMIELMRSADIESRAALEWVFAAAFPSAHGRISNHLGLFEPAGAARYEMRA